MLPSSTRKGKSTKKVSPSSVPQIDKKLSDLALICTFNKMRSYARTEGDGMEDIPESEAAVASTSSKEDSNSDISMIPQQVKRRELRFVPYEPYRAAVTPIVPLNESSHKASGSSVLKEAHIPFPLVESANIDNPFDNAQMPVMKVLRDVKVPDVLQSKNAIIIDASVYQAEKDAWRAENIKLEEDVKALRQAKLELENQFKIQAQVNKDLKKLLVASMGEDMQSRVQFLSEDKARLAHDISRYSQKFVEDNEELERRAILCDVWRSKFLACSLMVDELAGWKALLSRNFQEAKECISWLLEETDELKQNQLSVHRIMKQLQLAFDPDTTKVGKPVPQTSHNLLQVSQGNRQLAEAICLRLLGTTSNRSFVSDCWNCDQLTPAEDFAQKVNF